MRTGYVAIAPSAARPETSAPVMGEQPAGERSPLRALERLAQPLSASVTLPALETHFGILSGQPGVELLKTRMGEELRQGQQPYLGFGDLYRALGRYNGSLGQADYPNLVRAAWEGKWAWR